MLSNISHSKLSNIFHKHLRVKKGTAWMCEALKNIYLNLVWLIDLGNQNYPHLKKRVSSLSLLWLGQPTRYFVSAPCHVTTLHLATKGEEREGIFNNSRAQDPHSAWSRRGTAQGGEGVWWVGFLTISKYLIKYISFKNIKYIFYSNLHRREKPESAKHWRIFLWIVFD